MGDSNMKKLEKSTLPKLFHGTIGLLVWDIILFFSYIGGFVKTFEAYKMIAIVGGILGCVIANIIERKLNPKPYDKNDNYNVYFYWLLFCSTCILLCFAVLLALNL